MGFFWEKPEEPTLIWVRDGEVHEAVPINVTNLGINVTDSAEQVTNTG
jgi:hypothetical protein